MLAELLQGGLPVAVAPRGFAHAPARTWRDVTVAVDASGASDAAVAFAAALTTVREEPPRAIELVAVDEQPQLETFPEGVQLPHTPGREARLDAVLSRAAAVLLVCGAHGRGTLGRLVFGSVAEELAAGAACPVIVVPRTRAYAAT